MARTFILWLHGLGDSGPANEDIKTYFKSPELSNTRCLWFDVPELPFTAGSPIDESSVLEAVKDVHAIIDQEIAGAENVFICGLSQGDAFTLASVLLYPKTLGRGAVLIVWVPLSSSVISRFLEEAKKTPILWSHGTDDELVLFEAGQAALAFLEEAGVTYEFKRRSKSRKQSFFICGISQGGGGFSFPHITHSTLFQRILIDLNPFLCLDNLALWPPIRFSAGSLALASVLLYPKTPPWRSSSSP